MGAISFRRLSHGRQAHWRSVLVSASSSKRSAAKSSVAGSVTAPAPTGAKPPDDGRLRVWGAMVVTVGWACSFVASVIPALHDSPREAIHAAMLLVVGDIFGTEIR